MTVRTFVVVAVAATAVAGSAAATASAAAPQATSLQPTTVSSTAEDAASEIAAIDLNVTRNGRLAMTLTWTGGTAPYDVMIDPSTGQGRYEPDIDDTTLTVATEPDRDYCFEVFGSDGSESGRECVPTSR